jgi:uncharacterized membrane protein YphA (DoxX/SURF4 family)
MSSQSPPTPQRVGGAVVPVAARWLLGGLFLYMGLHKALDPVDFLKLVRQYDLVSWSLPLNLVGALLPWFEVFCALLLLTGVAVRGAALMLVAMLIPFTVVVIRRALAIHAAGGLPFCAIKFDCGCGNGEVFICRKIAENSLLTVLSMVLVFCRHSRLSLRHTLIAGAPGGATQPASASPEA